MRRIAAGPPTAPSRHDIVSSSGAPKTAAVARRSPSSSGESASVKRAGASIHARLGEAGPARDRQLAEGVFLVSRSSTLEPCRLSKSAPALPARVPAMSGYLGFPRAKAELSHGLTRREP